MVSVLGIVGVAGVGAAVAMGVLGPSSPTSADIVRSLANTETGMCLESFNTQVGTNRCNGDSSQKWILSSGTTVKKFGTNLCLGSDDRNQAFVEDCSDSSYQKWAFVGDNSGKTLRNLATEFCLASNGSKQVVTSACTGDPSQQWHQ